MVDQVYDILESRKNSNSLDNLNVIGNVGIGTTSPDRPLTIQSTGLGQELISFKDPDGNTKWHINQNVGGNNPGLNFVESGVADGRLFIKAGGDVGIGTMTPRAKLDVQGNIHAGNSDIYFTKVDHNHTGFGNTEGYAAIENAKDYNALMILGRAGTSKGRYVRLWDYLQINGSMDVTGNVGIGTTTPQAGLHIDKAGTNDLALKLSSTGPGWGSGIQLQNNNIRYGIYAGFGQFKICDANKQVDRLIINDAGNIGIGTTAPKYTLDVNGTINASSDVIVGGGDCAEEFDIVDAESIEPGTVMVIDNNGALRASEQAYDKRVAGVISGAGDLSPGITLDKQTNKANRLPLALTGKVYCKVDADCGAIEVGDLLTTSSTYGHAMRVSEHPRSLGAIIGKALRPLEAGCGLIPILVALQ